MHLTALADLNPIEEAFSKLKAMLQDCRAELNEEIHVCITDAFLSITEKDCRGYYRKYLRGEWPLRG